MSNWDWIEDLRDRLEEAGQHDVAEILFDLPAFALAENFDAVEAVAPVLIDYARQNKLPWLEIYARHWRLQAYATTETKLEQALPEAVALVARTTVDDVRDCPQTRCAVQDMSLCFGGVDAPGYAAERLQAIREMVERLPSDSDCSACMMCETVACLNSMGRHRDAYQHGVDWMDRAREEGFVFGNHFWSEQAGEILNAALAIGAFDEAKKILARSKPEKPQSRDAKAIAEARLALATGDPAAAARHLPSVKKIEAAPWLRRRWLEVAHALVKENALANDIALGGAAATIVRRCETNGQIRDTFDAAIEAALLATARRRWGAAKLRLDDAVRLRAKLRGDHGADTKLVAARTALAGMTASLEGQASDAEWILDQALAGNDTAKVEAALAKLGEPADRSNALMSAFGARG